MYIVKNALQVILDASLANSTTMTSDSGRETQSKVTGTLSATYVFADTDAYYAFEEEVRALGLDDSYTVDSPDISAFENSLAPLNTLSTIAGWFPVVILIIGGVIPVSHSPEVAQMCDERYELVKISGKSRKK